MYLQDFAPQVLADTLFSAGVEALHRLDVLEGFFCFLCSIATMVGILFRFRAGPADGDLLLVEEWGPA